MCLLASLGTKYHTAHGHHMCPLVNLTVVDIKTSVCNENVALFIYSLHDDPQKYRSFIEGRLSCVTSAFLAKMKEVEFVLFSRINSFFICHVTVTL